MTHFELALATLSLAIWIGLLGWRGQFWRSDQRLEQSQGATLKKLPSVCVVIPARDEADLLPITLRSLLTQDYPEIANVILVDDRSTDETATVAKTIAQSQPTLSLISGEALPEGWTGKLWATSQGIRQAQTLDNPDYILLTDADIEHEVSNISSLVAKAEQENLDLVSLMVQLRCETIWEHLLIPAFIFFFQKIYPFNWVNDPQNPVAAAAGGCILIRSATLKRLGGIQVVRQALIDDCALAKAVKASTGRIWLGLSTTTRSLRPYPSLTSIWDMVARTAFTQLNYSPWLLFGTLLSMILVYIVPPASAIAGLLTKEWNLALVGASSWLLMSWSYLPTIRLYKCPPILALCLPAIALLYTLMTLDSALRHWQGRGGAWKGRFYATLKQS